MHKAKLIGNIVSLALLMLMVTACGSKRNPTGGAQDVEKPLVLASTPTEFGDISEGVIEISFSKPMDRSTIANAVYIYPPVQRKKISLDGPNLKIKINEPLQDNTNYFVTLSTRLKDTRGNALAGNQTLVYKHGGLAKNRIAGVITYEVPADNGLPIELSLFSPDSLLVYSGRIDSGAYAIDNLNPFKHTLKCYIDKDINGRYDFGTEPYFEGVSDGSKLANLDINMAYADTSKVSIKGVTVVSNRELALHFSEPLAALPQVMIDAPEELKLSFVALEGKTMHIVTAPQDSLRYTLSVLNATDNKGNVSEKLEIQFWGTRKPDVTAPTLLYSNPRNGASVNTLMPVIELGFSEIIPADNIKLKLSSGTADIPFKVLSYTGKVHRIQPLKQLTNYSTHTLVLLSGTTDFSGNALGSDYTIQFLPLKRN